jgi:hypothetical protein
MHKLLKLVLACVFTFVISCTITYLVTFIYMKDFDDLEKFGSLIVGI